METREVMTSAVECISPSSTLQEAASKMRELDVGSLPVCDLDRLVGMVTDRDIALRSVSEGQDPHLETVRDIMTPEVIYCFADEDVEEVAALMRDRQVRRLPVLNRDKRLVGIVSLGDLALETTADLSGNALRGISA